MRYLWFLFSSLLVLSSSCNTDKYMQTRHYPATDNFLDTLLQARAARLGPVFRDPEKYHLQIIYTRIDRDAHNHPHFRDFYYRVDPHRYFYPASTVKLPGAALALEKLNDLRIAGLNRDTPFFTDSLAGITPTVRQDSTSPTGLPSVGHYIKKIFLVSDNDAFNRLYEFLGQQEFNERLWRKGYQQAQIRHRVGMNLETEAHRHTNAVRFERNGQVLYRQDARYSRQAFSPRQDSIGKAHYQRKTLVNGPLDFSEKNRLPLTDLHYMLRSIIFPESVTKSRRFRLTEDDYRFLYRCLSQLPTETNYPAYDTTEFHRAYVKFLLFGGEKNVQMPPGIRIFNKPGWAYGFLTDVAYIADLDHGIEFMLSATMYVNEDDILGDDHYEFNETGKPFLKALGQVIYEYELQRKRAYQPDLTRFKLVYD